MRGDFHLEPASEECDPVAWSGTVEFGDDVHGLYLSFTDVESVYRGHNTFGDNGVVTDTSLDYSEWLGRKARMSGDIVFVGLVPTLNGVLQLN